MALRYSRLAGPRIAANLALALLVGCGAAGIAGGAYFAGWAQRIELGVALMGGGTAALLFGVLAHAHAVMLHKLAANSLREYEALLDLAELLHKHTEYARTVAENSRLSDWAKKLVHRESDREFLRDAIHALTVAQNWDGAAHLIAAMAEEFGDPAEAESLKAQLAAARGATEEQKLASALARFETLCTARKWAQALAESQRLSRLFPANARIAGLPREVEQRREAYKQKLLKDYESAILTHDMDRAHDLLFELDRYLTPGEAAAYRESARGVFKVKLLQVGVQFSLAVSDRQFERAIEIGETLIREFPNSRYAREIASMLPILRQRAAQEAADRAPASA